MSEPSACANLRCCDALIAWPHISSSALDGRCSPTARCSSPLASRTTSACRSLPCTPCASSTAAAPWHHS
eukprot:7382485-Prymnesium_polylepis.1